MARTLAACISGTTPPAATGIWEIEDGKINVDCYPEGTIIFSQLGVLANLQAALMPVGGARDNDRA
jgi:hypothetical protein